MSVARQSKGGKSLSFGSWAVRNICCMILPVLARLNASTGRRRNIGLTRHISRKFCAQITLAGPCHASTVGVHMNASSQREYVARTTTTLSTEKQESLSFEHVSRQTQRSSQP